MSGNALLDTTAVVDLFHQIPALLNKLGQAASVAVPSIVIGELYFGAYKSGQVAQNLQQVDQFTASTAVLVPGVDTARHYGQIKNELRSKGKPIPENDVWIAALAIQHGLTLLSRDPHFQNVSNLVVEAW